VASVFSKTPSAATRRAPSRRSRPARELSAHEPAVPSTRAARRPRAADARLILFKQPLARGEVHACEEYGIAFLPWSPLGGIGRADDPDLIAPVREAARRHGVSPQRVALAWLLALSPAIVAIPGSKRPETILDSLAAAELELAPEEVEAISARVERRP